MEISLRELIFQQQALQSLLFSRNNFRRNGTNFNASQFTDDHLADLLKLGFKETQLEALQKSMELVTGNNLTRNLREIPKLARKKGLKDAGIAGEIKKGQLATAKYWFYSNMREIAELQVQRGTKKTVLAFHTNQPFFWKFSIRSDKAQGTHYTHLVLEISLEPASSKTSITINGIYGSGEKYYQTF